LFKEFYSKAKVESSKIEVKDYMNSARSSIGSLSSKLEQRRQRMAQMKADMMNIDKDKTKTKKKDEDDEKVDASKDQATQEVKPDGEKKDE
jgi:hypothetical protein